MNALRIVAAVLVTAFRRTRRERVAEAAAGMGFYAVFSLFPLLLLLIAVGSRLIEAPDAQERLLDVVVRFLPVSRELVRENVLNVVRARGAVGAVGAVGLVWSATSAFSTLVRNLGRAWPSARPRHMLVERLLALTIVACLVGLVLLYLVAKALVILPGEWVFAQQVASRVLALVPFPAAAALAVFIFCALTMLYKWLPPTTVLWREAAVGGAAAAGALWAATTAFTRFLGSGLVRYNLVYGSLGALLALLSWVYMASVIVLAGAHVGAAVASRTRQVGLGREGLGAGNVDAVRRGGRGPYGTGDKDESGAGFGAPPEGGE